MSEPWVNFSDADEEIDYVILLRPDRKERVHIYRRLNGSFGRRNYVWIADEYYQGWTVGVDRGVHIYDSVATALREARGAFAWVGEQLGA